jgi:hypothetical protein
MLEPVCLLPEILTMVSNKIMVFWNVTLHSSVAGTNIPLKHWYLSITLHGITIQKVGMRTTNPICQEKIKNCEPKNKHRSRIRNSHSSVAEHSCLLGCNTASLATIYSVQQHDNPEYLIFINSKVLPRMGHEGPEGE